MKTILKRAQILSTVVALLAPALAGAATYHPKEMVDVARAVAADKAAGKTPVVVFDLDDTLINTRDRNRRILQNFARQPDVQTSNPLDAETLSHLDTDDIRYNLADTFKDAGITDPALLAKAQAFWLQNFFSNEYAANDKPNRGAVDYANWLHNLGAKIVYLTGRDTPRMGVGTKSNLIALGFPMDDSADLMMKPDKSIPDLQFKKDSFDTIAGMGDVVGTFENEPANINAMHARFPESDSIFIDTIHSGAPDVVADGITWIRNFTVANKPSFDASTQVASASQQGGAGVAH